MTFNGLKFLPIYVRCVEVYYVMFRAFESRGGVERGWKVERGVEVRDDGLPTLKQNIAAI